MTTTFVTATGTDRLTPSEIEDLHIRLATAYSLNDTNIGTESIVSNILAGREDPVPLYTTATEQTQDEIRQKISKNDPNVWDSIVSVIEHGQIEALDHFIKLGLNVNSVHPR